MILILLLIKHYIADFVFQSRWMALGKGQLKGWLKPLLYHCFIHGFFTYWVIFPFTSDTIAGTCAIVGMIIHFIVDRIKAHPKLGGRWKTTEDNFWLALGADQLAHNLTYAGIYLSL